MASGLEIAPLTEADLPAERRLLNSVGLQGGAANVTRYQRWEPDGAWKLTQADQLIAMVTLLRQGEVGFVGCMAVQATLQGRGHGAALLEHAHGWGVRHGVSTFLLEATSEGEPLYRKLGYVVDYESVIFARSATGVAATTQIAETDQEAILALDRAATGCTRDTMLGALLSGFPGHVIRAADIVGYGLAVDDRLGPVIAKDAGAGRALVEGLAPGCTTAVTPLVNEASCAALGALGFVQARLLKRMRLGAPIPVHPTWIWALASPGAG